MTLRGIIPNIHDLVQGKVEADEKVTQADAKRNNALTSSNSHVKHSFVIIAGGKFGG